MAQLASFSDYDRLASTTDKLGGPNALNAALQGLFGEIGSVLSEVKKHQRDAISFQDYKTVVREELGDVLWYIASVARHSGFALNEIAQRLPQARLPKVEGGHVLFSELYDLDVAVEFEEDSEFSEPLMALAGEVGFVVGTYTHNPDQFFLRDKLSDILNMLIDVAHHSAITMSEIASSNLEKALSRWPAKRDFSSLPTFDSDYPDYERLPSRLAIEIRLVDDKFVYQTANGIHVGDRLTDNMEPEDYYRYHDVFHYAFAAVLHWSPVLRSLLRLKRKSNPSIDATEDGARAAIVEEGVSTFIFNKARTQNFFADVSIGELSFDLLKAVRDQVRGFEVDTCPAWLLEEAILQGYAAFRFLKQNGSGRLVIDREARRLEFSPL